MFKYPKSPKTLRFTTRQERILKCPFHADDTASIKIYPNINTFNCFGCDKNRDQIEIAF